MGRTAPRRLGAVAGLAAVLLVAGCGSGSDDPSPSGTTTEPTMTPTQPTPTGDTGTPADGPAEAAVQDLTQRLGVSADDVTVVRTAEVTWRDGSLGCPQPGMSYTQALVDGTLVELQAGGQTYRYHAGRDGEPFLCENPQEPVEQQS